MTKTVAAPAPARRVEQVMGTAIGIDVRDPGIAPSALEAAFALLRGVEKRFSTYKSDSEISRLGRGELLESECSPDVRLVLGLCDDLAATSNGYFDARRHRPDGLLDPSGVVKGWSIEGAGMLLEDAGARNYSINAGGDILVRGDAEPSRPWRVGIQHPLRRDRVATVLALTDRAIATSGGYERGDRVLDPHTGRPQRDLLSMTVVGPIMTYADAFATAAFAMGIDGVAWVARQPGYGAYAITCDERAIWTTTLDGLLA